ncbi:MAG: hypothetical protein LQ338_000603 [Usnochroma carphineum]|nr:MAG: hypothetical protein LQ338_000603 [Usnochroma carphineum]
MSSNVKNLTYESKEPAFLRKLKGEYGGRDSARHQRPLARAQKARDADEEHDDQPVYVHETSPYVPMSKADYDALLHASTTEREPVQKTQSETSVKGSYETEPSPEPSKKATLEDTQTKQQTAVIGASSKRRLVKVIGEDASSAEVQKSKGGEPMTVKKQVQRNAKRPKLSFQDD